MGRRACLAALLVAAATSAGPAAPGTAPRRDDPVINKAAGAPGMLDLVLEDGKVTGSLELEEECLEAFADLLPPEAYDEVDFGPDHVARPAAERRPWFFAHGLVVKGPDGELLPCRVVSYEKRPKTLRDLITTRPLPAAAQKGPPAWCFTLEWTCPGQPASLAIRPPMDELRGSALTTVGFRLFHGPQPVNDYRFLVREEHVDLDWEDPFYTRFRNKNLFRLNREPVQVFLYVEALEVRVELVVRPMDLQQVADLGLADHDRIPAAERRAVLDRAVAALRAGTRLEVDGREVEPRLDRVHFVRRSIGRTDVVPDGEDLDLVTPYIGAVFVQPVEDWPKAASLTWDLFPPRVEEVYAIAIDEAGGIPTQLTRAQHVLGWKNFLSDPSRPGFVAVPAPPPRPAFTVDLVRVLCGVAGVFALVLLRRRRLVALGAGAAGLALAVLLPPTWTVEVADPMAPLPAIGAAEAREVLEAQLRNVYKAFDRREESLVYDTLARSVDGPLLTRIFLETKRALEIENQGGARVKVFDLEVAEFAPEPLADAIGFAGKARWKVWGRVGHWGHLHERTNGYVADLRVEARDGAWKLVGLEILDRERM
ncbi:MAG: hypothetical protein R3F30_01545 [Planctomycetota bacterium]